MALKGFSRSCSKHCGGIRSIQLIEIDKITSITYNAVTDSFTTFTFESGSQFMGYEFDEDSASLIENIKVYSGSISVEHTLSFTLGKFNPQSLAVVEELNNASCKGFAALVETNNGDMFVVGYSAEFTSERPLRITQTEIMTGQKLKDSSYCRLIFVSEDVSPSKSFTGTIIY